MYQRTSDNRWVAVADLGVGLDGKRTRKNFYGTTREAAVKRRAAWLASAEAKRAKRSGSGAATVAEVIKVFLDSIVGDIRKASVRVRRISLLVHASPYLGAMRIDRVTDAHVADLYAQLRAKKKNSGTLRNLHTALRHLFKWSVARKLIAESPMAGVKRPKADDRRKRVRVWTPAEAKKLIETMHTRAYAPVFALMLRTGLRPGEAYALSVAAVDLERKTIRVEATLDPDGEIGPPKTKSSERTIQIDDAAVAILRASPWKEGLVFRGRDGGPINESSARRSLKSYCRAAGVPVLPPHSCRHTHATLLLLDNVPPHEVAARLGHKDATETLETYAHFIPSLARAAESIARTLG